MVKYYALLFAGSFLIFCNSDNIFDAKPQDFTSDFDALWTTFDEKYPLFDYKEVDWSQTYIDYRARFKDITLRERNNLFVELLRQLKDEHVTLQPPEGGALVIYRRNLEKNVNESFMSKFTSSSSWHKENDSWGWTIINNIGYLRFMQLVSIDTLVFDPVMEGLKATDGIVIDLRLCSGGSLLVSENIWNRFIDSEIKVGSQIYRDGPKHDDFAEPIIVVTEPRGNWQYLKPIAVLIGNFSGSVGEVFAETFSQFEHAVLLGETTRMSVTAPGSFLLNDGTKYRVPIVAYLDIFDQPLEGVGVSPDIHIANEEVVNNSEKDVIIDKAFEWIGATTQMAVIPTIPLVSSLK